MRGSWYPNADPSQKSCKHSLPQSHLSSPCAFEFDWLSTSVRGLRDCTGLRQAMLALRRKSVGEPERRGQDL